ncbi:sporulation protein YunB [Salirhabdus euzebyi]|uniref:Sporulation protein YunB n=1 Tax=Salirhabdus euzebyi TaxID=394506 RepID=A0A841Q538_9BACI|nr:sporulation protein YunB [Salirhabdus euzebyi]MBB6453452.1 sporulation protein YunB [Salirhabdus euzebyi]
MRRKFSKQRRSGPPPVGHVFAITLIVFLVMIFFSLWLIDKGLKPTLMEIAETEIRQVARDAINQAMSKKMTEDLQSDEVIDIETDNDGNITTLGWNPVVINRVQRNATYRVRNYLNNVERGIANPETSLDIEGEDNGGLEAESLNQLPAYTEIPLGQATNNALLANLGPKIPIRFTVIGDVQTDKKIEVREYGINGALVDLSIDLKVTVRIVVPFSTEEEEVSQNIFYDSRVIMGEVPDFYGGGGNDRGPQVTVPYDSLP